MAMRSNEAGIAFALAANATTITRTFVPTVLAGITWITHTLSSHAASSISMTVTCCVTVMFASITNIAGITVAAAKRSAPSVSKTRD